MRRPPHSAPICAVFPMVRRGSAGVGTAGRRRSTSGHQGLELVDPPEDNYTPWKQARLVVPEAELVFGPIGYADYAEGVLRGLLSAEARGRDPPARPFQVCIPSPIAPMVVLVEPGSSAAVEGPFTRRLLEEVGEIAAAVPHDDELANPERRGDLGYEQLLGLEQALANALLVRVLEEGRRVVRFGSMPYGRSRGRTAPARAQRLAYPTGAGEAGHWDRSCARERRRLASSKAL